MPTKTCYVGNVHKDGTAVLRAEDDSFSVVAPVTLSNLGLLKAGHKVTATYSIDPGTNRVTVTAINAL